MKLFVLIVTGLITVLSFSVLGNCAGNIDQEPTKRKMVPIPESKGKIVFQDHFDGKGSNPPRTGNDNINWGASYYLSLKDSVGIIRAGMVWPNIGLSTDYWEMQCYSRFSNNSKKDWQSIFFQGSTGDYIGIIKQGQYMLEIRSDNKITSTAMDFSNNGYYIFKIKKSPNDITAIIEDTEGRVLANKSLSSSFKSSSWALTIATPYPDSYICLDWIILKTYNMQDKLQ